MAKRKRYAVSFKQAVVQQYLLTEVSCRSLVKQRGIGSSGTIHKWTRELGYLTQPDERPKFERQIGFTLSKDQKQPTQQELEKRIRELERQLEDEKLRSELFSRMIDKTERELKISIRKKPGAK